MSVIAALTTTASYTITVAINDVTATFTTKSVAECYAHAADWVLTKYGDDPAWVEVCAEARHNLEALESYAANQEMDLAAEAAPHMIYRLNKQLLEVTDTTMSNGWPVRVSNKAMMLA